MCTYLFVWFVLVGGLFSPPQMKVQESSTRHFGPPLDARCVTSRGPWQSTMLLLRVVRLGCQPIHVELKSDCDSFLPTPSHDTSLVCVCVCVCVCVYVCVCVVCVCMCVAVEPRWTSAPCHNGHCIAHRRRTRSPVSVAVVAPPTAAAS